MNPRISDVEASRPLVEAGPDSDGPGEARVIGSTSADEDIAGGDLDRPATGHYAEYLALQARKVVRTGPEAQAEVRPDVGSSRVRLTVRDEAGRSVMLRLSPVHVDELCQALCDVSPREDVPQLPDVQVVTRADVAGCGQAAPARGGLLVARAESLRDQLTEALDRLRTSPQGSGRRTSSHVTGESVENQHQQWEAGAGRAASESGWW